MLNQDKVQFSLAEEGKKQGGYSPTAIIAAVVIVILAAGLIYYLTTWKKADKAGYGPENTAITEDKKEAGRIIELAMTAFNNSNQTGKAKIEAFGSKTKISIELDNYPAGVIQPSHIHTGSCFNAGGVKYSLNPVLNGKSETEINVSLDDLLSGLPLYINTHKSPGEIPISVACADIVK